MKFVCERCHTRYSIADEKVRQKILRIRCKTCGEVIIVQESKGLPDSGLRRGPAAPSRPAAAPPPPPPPPMAPAKAVEWYVSVNGVRQGPFTRTDAAKHILTTQETDDVHVWKDGMSGWKPAREVTVIARELSLLRPTAPAAAPPPPPPPPPPPIKTPGPVAKSPGPVKPSSVVPLAKGARITLPFEEEVTVPQSALGPVPEAGPAAVDASMDEKTIGDGAAVLPSVEDAVPARAASSASMPAVSGLPSASASATQMPRLSSSSSLPKIAVTPMPKVSTPSLPKLATTPMPKVAVTPMPKVSTSSLPKLATTPRPLSPLTPSPVSPSASSSSLPRPSASVIALPVPAPPPKVDVPAPAIDDDIFAGVKFDEDPEADGPKTPPPSTSTGQLPNAGASPISSVNLPASSSTVPAPVVLPAPTNLFPISISAPVTVPTSNAESGLSRLTGIAALAHKHQGMKYIIAGAAIVVLVVILVILSLRGDGGKKADEQRLKNPVTPPTVQKTEEELAKELAATVETEGTVGPGKPSSPRAPTNRGSGRSTGGSGSSSATVTAPQPPAAQPSKPSLTADQAAAQKRMASGGGARPVGPARPNPFASSDVKPVSQEQITAVVRNKDNQTALKACYDRALKMDNRLTSGRIDVTVSIGLSGMVQRVLLSAPPGFFVIENCIKSAVKRWVFPPSGEEYAANFPLILQGGM